MVSLSGSLALDAFTFFIALTTVFYFFLKWRYSHWERKGFKTLPGYGYVLGHLKSNFPPTKPMPFLIMDLYNQTNEPYIGIYTLLRPVLLARDPEFIKTILIKDFSYFIDRRVQFNEDYDPVQGHLFALPGHKWKPLRNKLSPTFTSGKLKAMFSTLVDCGASLQNYLEKVANKGDALDVRETAASYTTNVIASVGFGIDIDSFAEPNNDFRQFGRSVFGSSCFKRILTRFLIATAPGLIRTFKIKVLNEEEENFLTSVVKQNLEYREKNNVVRKDFFQLLIQLRNTGTVHLDDEWNTEIKGDENQKQMTLDEIKAQTFVFLVAGFETSSSTLSYCLYELAKNPEIQQRVHDEIDRILKEHDGKITYESVSEMKYLECCIDETLRKYSIVGILLRACVKDYQIPNTQTVIEKGTEIFIPVHALHHDPQYYPKPEVFDPNRFSGDNRAPYYPFGDGPRNCIGMRLGKMQTKVGLILMLQKFRFELSNKHKNRDLEFDPKTVILSPLGGISLNIFKR